MSRFILAALTAFFLTSGALAQGITITPPPGVPSTGGTFTGAIGFAGTGISTGLPTNGVYLNSANQCGATAGPTIALSAKDGAPVLQFLSSSETPTSKDDSVSLGYGALAAWNCATNGPVTALGSNALLSLTTGNHDTAVGYGALSLILSSQYNTAVGIDAGRYLADPSIQNTFLGQQTGTFGSSTIAGGTINDATYVGFSAGEFAGGSDNVAVGRASLCGSGVCTPLTSSQNVAVGSFALAILGGAASPNNTAIGYGAGALATATTNDILIGTNAASALTGGSGLIIIGVNAASSLLTGTNDIIIGVNQNTVSGVTANAVAIGQGAKAGSFDVCIGVNACHATNTDTRQNIMIGNGPGALVTSGNVEVLIGTNAGNKLTTGGSNVVIGPNVATTTLQTGGNNVLIGTSSSIDTAASGDSNVIQIGAGSTAIWKVTGSGTPTTAVETFTGTITLPNVTTGTNADFLCMAAGNVVTLQTSACTISSLRFKDVLGELDANRMVADIMALHPIAFKMKTPAEPNADPNYDRPQIGLTAENVAAIDPQLVIYEDDMRTPKSYRQEGIIAALVVTAQRQQWEIRALGIAVVLLMFWCAALTIAVRRQSIQ